MAVGTEVVAVRYENITEGAPISVPVPLYEAPDIQVIYGIAALTAVYNTDYTITLGDDFDTFTLTPTASLIAKINALIALDPDEENYITVRRRLDYLTDATAAAVRYTPFTSREFERTVLRFQQIQEQLNRALVLAPSFVGNQPLLRLTELVPGASLRVSGDGTALESGPLIPDIDEQAQRAEDEADRARDEADNAEEWAQSDDPISEAAGGDGVTDRSAKTWAGVASALTIPPSSITPDKLSEAYFTEGETTDLYGGQVYDTVAEGLASTEGPRGVGAIWQMGGFRYEEVASDGHVQTASGVELNVLLNDNGRLPVQAFGADPTDNAATVAATTSAIEKAMTAGTRFDWGSGTYRIQLTQGDIMGQWTGVAVEHVGQCLIKDTTVYSYTQSIFTVIFGVTGTGSSIRVDGVDYEGLPIPNPEVNLDDWGATFVRAWDRVKGVEVNSTIKNARHGIQSGKWRTLDEGLCSLFRGRLVTDTVGYPIATYHANDIEMELVSVRSHRAAYFAGAKHVRLNAQVQHWYEAPIQVLLTDAYIAPGASNGCSDCRISVTDMGSTVYPANSWLAGISPSFVEPSTQFSDIHFEVFVKSTNTVASTVGGVFINSNVKSILPEYTYNWIPQQSLNNITISGIIDRSSQTVAEHGSAEIYVVTNDGASAATVRGFSCENFLYIPGSGAKPRGFWFYMPNLTTPARWDNCYFGTETPVMIGTNASVQSVLTGCTMRGSWDSAQSESSFNSSLLFMGCEIAALAHQPATNKKFLQTKIGGSAVEFKTTILELTLTGGTVTSTGFPANCVILGATGVVSEAITGAAGFQVGLIGNLNKYADVTGTSVGTSFNIANFQSALTEVQYNKSAAPLYVTAKTSNFTGGKLRVVLHYLQITAPG